jgi:hypothetical protein
VGGGTPLDGPGTPVTNLEPTGDPFVDAANGDYHLRVGSEAIDAGSSPGTTESGESLVPSWEPGLDGEEVRFTVDALDIGAYEYNPDPSDTDTDTDADTDADADADADTDTDADTDADVEPEGCGCDGTGGVGLGMGLVAIGMARRRRSS